MQHSEIGTQKDLVLYRINAAKEDLQSAKILRDANSFKGANNRAYYAMVWKRIAAGSFRSRRQCNMKIQKCNIDKRNKIEVVNSETARGEAWGTSRAGIRI